MKQEDKLVEYYCTVGKGSIKHARILYPDPGESARYDVMHVYATKTNIGRRDKPYVRKSIRVSRKVFDFLRHDKDGLLHKRLLAFITKLDEEERRRHSEHD